MFCIVPLGSRFQPLLTRDDLWLEDRFAKRICTVGFEVVEPPCWSSLAVLVARIGLLRPNGGDWTVSATALRNLDLHAATTSCRHATVWYADDARNVFLSDGHAYAVVRDATLPLRGDVTLCPLRSRPHVYTFTNGSTIAAAGQTR